MKGQLRQEMTTCLSLISEGEKGRELFRFVSPKEAECLGQVAGRLKRSAPDLRSLKTRLLNLTRFGRRLAFEDVHPSWILEEVKGETPRLLLLLSQVLSTPKSELLRASLTATSRHHLLKPTRPVSPDLLDLLRTLLEKRLGGISPLKAEGGFLFSHIACLKGDDLTILFEDLGFEELRKALSGADPRLVVALITRFPLTRAVEIRNRLSSNSEVSSEERDRARGHLLSLTLGHVSPERFFSEIGYSVFTEALNPEDLNWATACYRKLAVGDGYRLKRLIQEVRARGEAGDPKRREEILRRLFVLATKGKIRRYWKEEREIEQTVVFKKEDAA